MTLRVRVVLLVAIFALNNLVWWQILDGRQVIAEVTPPTVDALCVSVPRPVTSVAFISSDTLRQNTEQSPAAAAKQITEQSAEEPSPMENYMGEADIPPEQSEDFLFEREVDAAFFFQADEQKKLEILEALTAQGDDLLLLEEVLKTHENPNVKIAAIHKLQHQQSFAITNLLLHTLDDQVPEVAIAALNTLAANGDRTLIPLLRKKMSDLPYGAGRDQYEHSITRLEQSVSMGMDDFAR